jgi:hypothetical protein
VDGIDKLVIVEIVKLVVGLVLWYMNVPFCNDNQLSAGVVNVPAMLQFNCVVWDIPLLTITEPKIVTGLPVVLVILADAFPLNVVGTFDRFTRAVVEEPFVNPLASLVRVPPMVKVWLFAPPHVPSKAHVAQTVTFPLTTTF